jgi:hypothetical protein
MTALRTLKNAAKGCIHGAFALGQRFGWDVLPRHFYSEIPDLRRLRSETAWKQPYSMIGVKGIETESQALFLRSIVSPLLIERLSHGGIYRIACERNGEQGFGQIEAECLYAFVYSRRPARITQVGCGVSTAVCLQAAEDAGYAPEIVCIDPFAGDFLQKSAAAGQIRLIRKRIEDLAPRDVMPSLSSGDLFFVDSTHCLGPAGEVSRLILEFLPSLPPGAYAHFHDIYFPFDYSPDLLSSALFFHHESPLLHAFLLGNERFQLCAALSFLHHRAGSVLNELFRNYESCRLDDGLQASAGHFPSSAYLRVNDGS